MDRDHIVRRLELTNKLLFEMARGSRVEDILDVMFRELRGLVPADRIAIAIRDPERGDLVVAALKQDGAGEVHLPLGHIQEAGDPRLYPVVARGETSIIGDLEGFLRDHPESDSTRRIVLEGMRSNLAVPLRIGSETLGIMSLSTRRRRAYTADHGRLIAEISPHVAVATEKARLIAELSDRNDRLEQANRDLKAANELKAGFLRKVEEEVDRQTARLHRASERERTLRRIAGAVNASLDLEAVFKATVDELRDLVPFDRASITLLDATGQHVEFAALVPAEREILGRRDRIPTRGTTIGEAIASRRAIRRDDLSRIRRLGDEDLLFTAGIRSFLVTPLILRGQAIGTFNAASIRPAAYTEEDAHLLEQVAEHMTTAVANARAYAEIRGLKDELQRENIYLKDELSTEHHFFEVVGSDPRLTKALRDAERVALTDSTVLIRGETGTGKELIARAIHRLSSRRDRALIKVNCAALPETLIASELFGHEKGAFTGAVAQKLGRFELADGGTIFLDEIGDLPPEIQVKILRVLQEREFERVGGTQTLKVDVRIIAATNRDLEELNARGAFRHDLYYRLNVFPILLPPLRERPEDILDLAMHFVRKHGRKQNKKITRIAQRSAALLQSYHWPGNVRELENLVERAVILCEGQTLSIDERWLHPQPTTPSGEFKSVGDLESHLTDVERRFFQEVLRQCKGRIYGPKGAALKLGLPPTTLQSRLRKLGIS